MTETLAQDDPIVLCLTRPAIAIGFPATMGVCELFALGGHLSSDDELWAHVEAAWQLECLSPEPRADVRDIENAVLRSLSEHDRARFRNRALARRNAERALNSSSKV